MTEKKEVHTTQLMDWLEGKLDTAASADIARAVEQDATLKATAGWLRTFLDVSAVTQLAEPDDTIRRVATAHFRAYAQGKRRPGLVQTLLGALSSDSWQRLSLAGVRHVTLQTTPRQLIFTTTAADVALNIHATHAQAQDDQLHLAGQVFPFGAEEAAAFTVQLLHQEQEIGLTMTDALGKFTFPALAEGVYDLFLTGDNYEIVVPELELAFN